MWYEVAAGRAYLAAKQYGKVCTQGSACRQLVGQEAGCRAVWSCTAADGLRLHASIGAPHPTLARPNP